MNKNDRAQVAKVIGMLEEAKSILEDLSCAEREKFDNMTEGLQSSERGQAIDQAAEGLETAFGNVEEAIDNLENLE